MRVKIDRDVCDSHLAFCERCLGQFLKHPMGYERHCFEEIIDDGSDILTIELHTEGKDVVLELDEKQRQLAAGEGWAYFVDVAIPMYRKKED